MNKILIRPLRFEDASVSWKWRNDSEVWEHTGSRPDIVVTEEIEKQWILDKLKERNSVRFAIEVDDVYVGNIQLTNIVEKETAEYHVFIGDKLYWGKGVASLATAQIIRYAKNVINLQSLYLSVRPENNSAIRVYEKSGFVKINDDVKMTLDLSKVNTPLVSVFMMAYNHEKYISEAIEGVLMQNTNFDFDIVIGEDCSTDNTRQIILDYQRKYPGKFKLLLHEKNIGAMANQMAVFKACTGKYIALCEGDDYWTYPYKLQKQVDFLEANEEYSGCGHLFQTLNDGIYIDSVTDIQKKTLTDVLNCNLNIHTATFVFRRKYLRYPKFDFLSGDMFLFTLMALEGSIFVLNGKMSVYRKHPGGVSSDVNILKIKKDKRVVNWFNENYKGFPKKAMCAKIYYTFIANTTNLSQIKILYYFFVCKYNLFFSKVPMDILDKKLNELFAFKLNKILRRIFRKIGIIKNYA